MLALAPRLTLTLALHPRTGPGQGGPPVDRGDFLRVKRNGYLLRHVGRRPISLSSDGPALFGSRPLRMMARGTVIRSRPLSLEENRLNRPCETLLFPTAQVLDYAKFADFIFDRLGLRYLSKRGFSTRKRYFSGGRAAFGALFRSRTREEENSPSLDRSPNYLQRQMLRSF